MEYRFMELVCRLPASRRCSLQVAHSNTQFLYLPTHWTVHPGMVGVSIAMFVLPQALGKAAAM